MTASWANVELMGVRSGMPGHWTQYLDIVRSLLVLQNTMS